MGTKTKPLVRRVIYELPFVRQVIYQCSVENGEKKTTANVYIYLLHLEPCFFTSIPEASLTQPDYEHVRNWGEFMTWKS